MATAISVRIPAGKLGTVRVDRTIDVYPSSVNNDETTFNRKSPTLALHRQLPKTTITATPTPLIIDPSEEQIPIEDEPRYIPITRWIDTADGNNNQTSRFDDEPMSDIAVIYSLVRHTSTRRTSSPKIIVSSTPSPIPRPQLAKTYTLEAPLTPIVSHASKQAQIKTLSSSTRPPTANLSTSSQSYLSTSLTPSVRIQSSTSFTSHDRPSIPSIAIKPRPYSFRSAVNPSNDISVIPSPQTRTSQTTLRSRRSFRAAPRNALERQISNITGRVSQLHDSFLARLSDLTSSTTNRQRNRSLTSLHSQAVNPPMNESEQRCSNTRHQRRSIKPRPKSETYDDHHRVNAGK